MESNTAPAKQSGLQPGCYTVGWSATLRDRAHPLFSAHATALPPDSWQEGCRFIPISHELSLSIYAGAVEKAQNEHTQKIEVQVQPALSCMSTDSVSLVAVIIIFYFISIIYTYTKALDELAHT